MPKIGYRLEITLYKTKLARNPNGEKRFGTDYLQVSQEPSHSITLGTVRTKKEGMAQFDKAKAAVGATL